MSCRLSPLWLRLSATILVALSLVVAGQARAAMPFSGPLMAVEICHDAQVTTVWLDADGKEHPAPQDCRDCCLCALPVPVLSSSAGGAAPHEITPTAASCLTERPGTTLRDHQSPQGRGPPMSQSQRASA